MIVLLPGEDAGARPAAALFLPVTDYRQLIRKLKPEDASAKIVEVQVGDQWFAIGNRGGYAVVAKKSNGHAVEQALNSSTSVAADMAALRGMLTKGDVAVAVTHHGVETISVLGQAALQKVKKTQVDDKGLDIPYMFDAEIFGAGYQEQKNLE